MRTGCLTIFCIFCIQVYGQRIAKFVISPGAVTHIQKDTGIVHFIIHDRITGYAKGADGSKIYVGFLTPVFSSNTTSTITIDRKEVKVFPNPVTNQITIQSGSYSGPAVLQIMDLNGRILFSEKNYVKDHRIILGYFVSGIYLLKIIYPDGQFEFHKLLKI